MGNGDKVDIHQPFAQSGNVLAAGEDHHVGFIIQRIVAAVFQHFGKPHLRLRIALLELPQNGEQAATREDTVNHEVEPGPHAALQRRGARLDVRERLQQRFNLIQ